MAVENDLGRDTVRTLVRRIAVPSMLAQFVSVLYSIVDRMYIGNIPRAGDVALAGVGVCGAVLAIGFSPFLIIAVDNIMIIAMNAVLQRYGGAAQGDMLVTCATIAQSFMLVVTMPLGGISGGTQSILSFNFGARSKERVLSAQREIIKLCVAYTALLFVLARLAGPLFVGLFTRDAAVSALSLWAIRVCTAAIIPLGVQYEIVDGFTAMGQVRIAFSLSVSRKAVYFISLFLLPVFFSAQSVFWAETISDIVAPVVSVIVYHLTIQKVLDRGPGQL